VDLCIKSTGPRSVATIRTGTPTSAARSRLRCARVLPQRDEGPMWLYDDPYEPCSAFHLPQEGAGTVSSADAGRPCRRLGSKDPDLVKR
jgi:hypothetical protein